MLEENKSKRILHVLPRNDRWAVKKHFAKNASKVCKERYEAIMTAMKKAEHEVFDQVLVHAADGTIALEINIIKE